MSNSRAKTEHHFKQSAALRDLVIGMSDGLTVPFALAAGLSAAVHSNSIVIVAGIAEIVAGSISMGLGGYLAGRTEIEHYQSERKRELLEIERVPETEKQEVREVFEGYGLSPEAQEMIVRELSNDKDLWADFMMRFELGLERPAQNQASLSAMRIGFSYAVGGIIPLSAYGFTPDPRSGLIASSIITACSLLAFGFLKSKVTAQNPWIGALRVFSIGALAAFAAFLIARLVSGA